MLVHLSAPYSASKLLQPLDLCYFPLEVNLMLLSKLAFLPIVPFYYLQNGKNDSFVALLYIASIPKAIYGLRWLLKLISSS